MNSFDEFIKTLREKTNWKEPKKDANGMFFFSIIGKNKEEFKLEFFTPNEHFLIMQVKLCSLPKNDFERNELLKEYAKKQVAACKKRPSILTVDNNYIILYKKYEIRDIQKLINSVSDFLKDVDWWLEKEKNQINFMNFSLSWK